MIVVVDAHTVQTGSTGVVVGNILAGWRRAMPDDELIVVSAGPLPFALPDGVTHVLDRPSVGGVVGRLVQRVAGVRSVARRVQADAVINGVTAGGLLPTPGRRGAIVYDLRHELRPQQFSRSRRWVRRVTYALSFVMSDVLICISERTRDDLVRNHPRTARRALVARLGSNHIDEWPTAQPRTQPYALAFGHFANKNVEAVLDAWAAFCATDATWLLRLLGTSSDDRAKVQERVDRLQIADRVDLVGWLDDGEFEQVFVSAGLVIFPSDFEGFGLPAVEALRRGIPVVVSADPALVEVTGGHAVVAASTQPDDVAAAIAQALTRTAAQRAAGQAWTDGLTWEATARAIRGALTAG